MPEYTRDLDAYGPSGRVKPSATFTRAPDGAGLADPETLGGSRHSIKQIINHNARTLLDAQLELALVDDALEGGGREGLVHSEVVLLNRRRKVLARRVEGKDARYMAVGARKGRLSPEEQAKVDQYQALLDLVGKVDQYRVLLDSVGVVFGPHPHVV